MAPTSQYPTGKGRRRWTIRRKAPLSDIQIAFAGRLPSTNQRSHNNQGRPLS
jgi:hypothetical protein